MYAPKNKQELFSYLDNVFKIALDIKEQSNVWLSCINQSLKTNPRLEGRVGDDHLVILQNYLKDRTKRGLKADYD